MSPSNISLYCAGDSPGNRVQMQTLIWDGWVGPESLHFYHTP